jgi:hypothetical protein
MCAPALTGGPPADDDAVVSSKYHDKTARLTAIRIALLGAVFFQLVAGFCPASAADAPDFCERVRSLRTQTCLARYDCTAQPDALTRLRNAACACMRNVRPAATDAMQLVALADRTRSFACCYGIAIAGMPDLACGTAPN